MASALQVAEPPPSYTLATSDVRQEQSNWCWAAVVKAILAYLGETGMSQCDVVKAGKGTPVCDNVTGTALDQWRAFNAWFVDGLVEYTWLTFDAIKAEVYTSRRPFSAGWFWNVGGGHAVMADGYESAPTPAVYYMDPWEGAHHWATYDWFKGGSGSDHVWGNTVYHLDPIAAGSQVPRETQAAAERGLAEVRDKVRAQPARFGFGGPEDATGLTLGEGFRLRYVDPDRLRQAAAPAGLLPLTYLAPVWVFLVLLDGQPRSRLTIAVQDGQYRLVSFGGDGALFGTALAHFRRLTAEQGGSAEPLLVKAGPVYYFAAQVGPSEVALAAVPPEKAQAEGLHYHRLAPAADVVRHLQDVQKNAPPDHMAGRP